KQVKESEKLELALIENIQRKDLNPIEEAFAFERLIDEFDLTHEAVAKKIGKSRPYVSNILGLLSLPSEIQQGLINNLINYSSARAVAGLENAREQLKMYRQLTKVRKPTREVEDNIAHRKYKTSGITRRDPLIMDYEKRLREMLGTRVKITQKGEKGAILIEYYSREEFQRIFKIIMV
ncbi:MAG: ParB/RepB/Spo0J family partition protein, partial [Candidatus Magasanikbacteria bacterium]|nr:ParB/RepB/Spo0J family partition protein [Candidatus Magasanikbacteria bacterium]